MRRIALVVLTLALTPLGGCGAVSSLSRASTELDAYTLSPATGDGAAGGGGHLIVELPTSAGALGTDRILIKPLPYQAQYLPDGRWSEPTPALVQTLLIASFQNLGGFRLVSRSANGLSPDYTVVTDIQDFQVEPTGPGSEVFAVKIGLIVTLIRESDRSIIASRRFTSGGTVASDDTLALVAGFERALQMVLRDVVVWARSRT
jgi:cholesterol transport system auxiliary component